jgi:hypothetical protein
VKSRKLGKSTSVEVQNISGEGIWLLVNDHEYFLSYKDFPWFRDARVKEICNVEFLHQQHLHWPDLDVDLHIDSLENLEKYPLLYKTQLRK